MLPMQGAQVQSLVREVPRAAHTATPAPTPPRKEKDSKQNPAEIQGEGKQTPPDGEAARVCKGGRSC